MCAKRTIDLTMKDNGFPSGIVVCEFAYFGRYVTVAMKFSLWGKTRIQESIAICHPRDTHDPCIGMRVAVRKACGVALTPIDKDLFERLRYIALPDIYSAFRKFQRDEQISYQELD